MIQGLKRLPLIRSSGLTATLVSDAVKNNPMEELFKRMEATTMEILLTLALNPTLILLVGAQSRGARLVCLL